MSQKNSGMLRAAGICFCRILKLVRWYNTIDVYYTEVETRILENLTAYSKWAHSQACLGKTVLDLKKLK